mgnify:CR=1 FL=1
MSSTFPEMDTRTSTSSIQIKSSFESCCGRRLFSVLPSQLPFWLRVPPDNQIEFKLTSEQHLSPKKGFQLSQVSWSAIITFTSNFKLEAEGLFELQRGSSSSICFVL